MRSCPRRPRGVFILEAICALVIIGVTLGAVSMLLIHYERMQEYVFTHRRLQLAAEGQMERYRSGRPLPQDRASFDGPSGIQLRVECRPGAGEWEGLQYVRLTATAALRHGKQASYQLMGYVDRVGAPGGATVQPGTQASRGGAIPSPPSEAEERRP